MKKIQRISLYIALRKINNYPSSPQNSWDVDFKKDPHIFDTKTRYNSKFLAPKLRFRFNKRYTKRAPPFKYRINILSAVEAAF